MYSDILCTLCRFGACFLWDSGSSVGDISAQGKAVNSVTYKPTRPFRVATASEDFTCAFFEGPPFKFKTTMKVGIMSCHQFLICCYNCDRITLALSIVSDSHQMVIFFVVEAQMDWLAFMMERLLRK